jgi:hypothetical protein
MKKLLWFGNCQAYGLDTFLKMNPRYWAEFELGHTEVDLVGVKQPPSPGTIVNQQRQEMGVLNTQVLMDAIREADVFIYHYLNPGDIKHKITTRDLIPMMKPGAICVPLSVVHNNGMFTRLEFMAENRKLAIAQEVKARGLTSIIHHYATVGNLDWRSRFDYCLEKMKTKEQAEGVPAETRVSDLVQRKDFLPLLTHYHPTSTLYWLWAVRLARYLGIPFEDEALRAFPEDLGSVPLRDFVCEAARKHLGLTFRIDQESAMRQVSDTIKGCLPHRKGYSPQAGV